jgi:hypothetical protein
LSGTSHRVLDQVGGEGVHNHAEQFLAADTLAAHDRMMA